jgi:hypothetical protein
MLRKIYRYSGFPGDRGGGPEHIARPTLSVVDRDGHRTRREVIGRHDPAMTMIEVAGFVEDVARVAIEVTAVIPD